MDTDFTEYILVYIKIKRISLKRAFIEIAKGKITILQSRKYLV